MRRSLVTVVALTALSACGSSPATTTAAPPKVATLQSAAAAQSSAAPKKERPRETIGMTAEDQEALLGPYLKCMREQGYDPILARKNGDSANSAAGDEANRICEPQYLPLPPWERDPANPEARDFAVGVVKCLKGKGVEYVAVGDDGVGISLGGDQNDSRSISLGLDHMSECEREVAAKS
ncbi:hypothetical protein [Actinoplanes derwentensis]|uniref:Secreted protein n=1 Tax=Actinoplanes derwentensis TaxID=113562 RepID=A0A1H1UIR4_9ACTN|nr:hypothetical protein [Actinoplanes derwentensis]GID88076.1 hypothetical protein Ade03nite_70000 [Actinoplanes derwentensis]SDS72343.1 hypothetical protein SAMN04489716_1452 [Actinoplanes derwentensis]